jgi:hypothetical protein
MINILVLYQQIQLGKQIIDIPPSKNCSRTVNPPTPQKLFKSVQLTP